jgi:Bacterial regulatory helix-turn-helix protein, lysR family
VFGWEHDVEWSDLRILLAIALEGTLSAAARRLGQTQPTIGRRLQTLEPAIGHTLFQRTADGFVLTDEGAGVLAAGMACTIMRRVAHGSVDRPLKLIHKIALCCGDAQKSIEVLRGNFVRLRIQVPKPARLSDERSKLENLLSRRRSRRTS